MIWTCSSNLGQKEGPTSPRKKEDDNYRLLQTSAENFFDGVIRGCLTPQQNAPCAFFNDHCNLPRVQCKFLSKLKFHDR